MKVSSISLPYFSAFLFLPEAIGHRFTNVGIMTKYDTDMDKDLDKMERITSEHCLMDSFNEVDPNSDWKPTVMIFGGNEYAPETNEERDTEQRLDAALGGARKEYYFAYEFWYSSWGCDLCPDDAKKVEETEQYALKQYLTNIDNEDDDENKRNNRLGSIRSNTFGKEKNPILDEWEDAFCKCLVDSSQIAFRDATNCKIYIGGSDARGADTQGENTIGSASSRMI